MRSRCRGNVIHDACHSLLPEVDDRCRILRMSRTQISTLDIFCSCCRPRRVAGGRLEN
jgi:hypothetical protein